MTTDHIIYRPSATTGMIERAETITADSPAAAARKTLRVKSLAVIRRNTWDGDNSIIRPFVDTPDGGAEKFTASSGNAVWAVAATRTSP